MQPQLQIQPSRKPLIIAVIIATIIVLGLTVALSANQAAKTAKINLDVTPLSSQLTINGKTTKAGTQKLKPGSYIITATKPGFASQSQTITLIKNQTTFTGFVLLSNDPSTTNWYASHADDNAELQKISGQQYQKNVSQALKALPLIGLLPEIDNFYRIDYGKSVAHPTDAAAVAIYITYYSADGKQQALDWLNYKGYDPTNLEIIYQDKTSQGFN